MAAIDVTRAEFEALLTRVTSVEGIAVDVGDQFEKSKEKHTELVSNAVLQGGHTSEHAEKIKKLEEMGIEAKFAELVDKMKKFESLNVESTIKDIADEITRMQLQMTNEKAEFEQLQRDAIGASEARIEQEKSTREQELQDVSSKVLELQKQSKPQPAEATAELMRELEEKVGASTARSL